MRVCRYYKRARIFQWLILGTVSATLFYLYYYSTLYTEESSPKPVRRRLVIKQQATIKRTGNDVIVSRPTRNDVMSKRLKLLEDRCQKADIIRKSRNFRFPIAKHAEDPFYRFKRSKTCMCKVPKVASTMLSKLLIAAEYPKNSSFIQQLPGFYIHDANLTARFQGPSCSVETDLKFLVVRNPYSRIFSAYIDKIYLGKFREFTSMIQYVTGQNKTVYQYFTQAENISTDYLCSQHDVSFEAFLRWILFHFKVDWHFAPITNFCNPCAHHFDVIIKQENSRDEMTYVTEHLPVTMDTSAFTDSSNDEKIRDLIEILNGLWNKNLSREECEHSTVNYTFLNDRFWNTLKIQGYISRHQTGLIDLFSRNSKAKEVFEKFKALKLPFLNKEERSLQRQYYLVQAYKSLDKTIIQHFKYRYYGDFMLFDYKLDPPSEQEL